VDVQGAGPPEEHVHLREKAKGDDITLSKQDRKRHLQNEDKVSPSMERFA
jgi:hypothetical protein